MFVKTAKDVKQERIEAQEEQRGLELSEDFLDMLNTWHSTPEPYDKNLDAYILENKVSILRNPVGETERGVRYFTPSSANSCPRELFHRLRGDKRDNHDIQPHQGRWQRLGTSFGDMVQRDLLFIHKYYKKLIGTEPAFVPKYLQLELGGQLKKVPFWEEFAAKHVSVEHNGVTVNLKGQPDGVLKYKDGSTIGLEIKSKQTSYSRTGSFSMRGPEQSHFKQVVAYSILYGIDEFLIVYGNLAKKDWILNEEDQHKYPDVRAFYVNITDEDRKELLDRFAGILKAVAENEPPKLDVTKWTFNRYKTVCAQTMTNHEIEEIREMLSYAEKKLEQAKTEVEGTKKKVPNALINEVEKLQSILTFIEEVKANG
jgi:hypothetical protein